MLEYLPAAEATVTKPLSNMLRYGLLASPLLLTACGGGGSTSPVQAVKDWTWMGGTYIGNWTGMYGTKGQPSSGNLPGSREAAASWTDGSGNFWLFGGFGVDANGNQNVLNDLWEYNTGSNEWTWVGGSEVVSAAGAYGTEGTASATTVPGARKEAVSWKDASGNFWLFGGYGVDANGSVNVLNDLWEFSPASKEWTWVSGSMTGGNQNCCTPGIATATNMPGAREGATGWIDASGNLWLFSGLYQAPDGSGYELSDLWEFNPSSKEWTWVSMGVPGGYGVYGTKGVAAASNVPGGRQNMLSWTDAEGNFWLFGGEQIDTSTGLGINSEWNDLWKFDPVSEEWTWMGGSNKADAPGVYGALGVAAATNIPGARAGSVGWTDASGNFWLFGGYGSTTGENSANFGDLWEFDPGNLEWTWVSGSNSANSVGKYGTQDQAAVTNAPPARAAASGWFDAGGNLWLFGGVGTTTPLPAGADTLLNDLWNYQP